MKRKSSSGAGKIIFLHFPTTLFFGVLGLIFVSSHMYLENPKGTLVIINVE